MFTLLKDWLERVIKSLKEFFSAEKRWSSFGILLALLLALPAMIWGFSTMRFETRKRAAIGEVTPTPTSGFKVLTIIFNPVLESQGGQKLTAYKGWNDPDQLNSQYIQDLKEVSSGYASYEITKRIEVDDIPTKMDGFDYTDESYLTCLQNSSTCHVPDQPINYGKIFEDFKVCDIVNANNISEVWIWGGPFFGYWEYNVKGPYLNLSSENLPNCGKTIYVMGFSYERNVGEMLEDFGHRTEAILIQVVANGNWQQDETNEWNKFTCFRCANIHCGNLHYAPNSEKDYDWWNQRYVSSNCDDWYTYPNLPGNYKQINCTEWGCNPRGHHKWWLKHLPKAEGTTNGKLNNWWRYLVDYDGTLSSTPTPTPTPTLTPTPKPTPTPARGRPQPKPTRPPKR